MGVGKAHIDNEESGGLFINYNLKKLRLDKKAYCYFGHGGKTYLKHPNTNFIFENTELPYPEQIFKNVKKAAQLFPNSKIIGWDIAFTSEGPVIIEGNGKPDLLSLEILSKGLKNHAFFKKVIS